MSDMGHVARVGQLLGHWAVKAVDVLIEQFPFFIICFSVLGGGWVAQSVYSGEPLTSVRTLGGVALLVLYSWGITALIAATGSRWVKVLAYTLLILLKVTDHYLLVNFGAHLGPEPLRLLAETNMSEASEFLDDLYSTPVSCGSMCCCCLSLSWCSWVSGFGPGWHDACRTTGCACCWAPLSCLLQSLASTVVAFLFRWLHAAPPSS